MAIVASDQPLAGALAGVLVAALVCHRSDQMACARFAPVTIVFVQIPEAVFASVAATPRLDIPLAVTSARHQIVLGVRFAVANAHILRTTAVALAF